MSNVLVGIIGIILFIGLALAGAMFLGPRFKESRNTALASATVQTVSQVSNAANMYAVENQQHIAAGSDPDILRIGGYLRSVPPNPTGVENLRLLSVDATLTGVGAYAIVRLNPDSAASQICAAIVRQTANGNDTIGIDGVPEVSGPAQIPYGPSGCFKAVAGFGNIAADNYYAFSRF